MNFIVNLGSFLSHPIFTPYYIVPIAMLSLWSTAFAWLMQQEQARQAAPLGREPTSLGVPSR
ncbi:hypothetical protein [Bradyrhizobium vignae]|uniref:Uncharacterized protein n=1 Tax=Bradyrhizobium vignae TaxID=1549949 RepID=A0A2U3Q7U4_9BRAD|nr:hypothetical protein [Bradyrhizobium vignae]SPP97492.1 protein of unknown function [Bradyrhizobium vignae]